MSDRNKTMGQIISNGKDGFFGNLSLFQTEDGYRSGGVATVEAGADLDLFLSLSGGDYSVDRVPAPHPTKAGESVPGQFFLVRGSDQTVVSPKTVTKSCGIITPRDLADSVRDLVDHGWLQASDLMLQKREGIVGQTEVLAFRVSDEHRPTIGDEGDWGWYVLLKNPHGRGKVTGSIAAFRPSCTNQIAGIMRSFDWSVSHRIAKGDEDGTKRKVITAVERWETLRKNIAAMARNLGLLLDVPMGEDEALASVNRVLKIDPTAEDEAISGNKRNKRDAILSEFHNERRATFGRTAFDLYMATTAFTTHGSDLVKSTMDPATRATSILDGGLGTLEAAMAEDLLALAN